MVWRAGNGKATVPEPDDVRCGVTRGSMSTNILLNKTEIGKVRKTVFNDLPPNHVYGYEPPKDPENAKQVTMTWKDHQPNPSDVPGPDFKAMNRLATMHGLTGAPEQRSFRRENPVLMKEGVPPPAPLLPSDVNPRHTYGKPPGHRNAEDHRYMGPSEPKLKDCIQARFQYDWVKANSGRTQALNEAGRKKLILPPPLPTKASEGHAFGATRFESEVEEAALDLWKMTKFTRVESKVAEAWKAVA